MADERDIERDLDTGDASFMDRTSAEVVRWSQIGTAEFTNKTGGGGWRRVGGKDQRAGVAAGETTSRALGESTDQGSVGPYILDRSFSGTYED